jgi:hypothetical protein
LSGGHSVLGIVVQGLAFLEWLSGGHNVLGIVVQGLAFLGMVVWRT